MISRQLKTEAAEPAGTRARGAPHGRRGPDVGTALMRGHSSKAAADEYGC